MITKFLEFGKNRVYVFLDDPDSEALGRKFAATLDLPFYPKVNSIDKYIKRSVYNGYLVAVSKAKRGAVVSASKSLMEKLDLKEEEFLLETDDIPPIQDKEKEKKPSIKDAKVVFIGGRGLGNRANYDRLKAVATKMGYACGCTRPVAMNGWESYDNFVGISGNILDADLVVTFGVAGAGPLVKGIENCKKIIAINNDNNALIFRYADYGIVEDCLTVISKLEKE